MKNTLSLKRGVLAFIALSIVSLLAFAVIYGLFASNYPTRAAASSSNSSDPGSPTGGPFACTIANIAVFSNRIHVYCSAPVPATSIRYFAAAGDSDHALATNRFLTLLNTAYALGKPVYIYYFDNTANNPAGCQVNDCRGIDWIFIVP